MEFKGSQRIIASRAAVWQRLNDPVTLQQCLPGCEHYQQAEDGSYDVVIVAAVGPIKARFKGNARFLDLLENIGYRIEGGGSGGIAGFGKLVADVHLEDMDGGTTLQYAATVQLGSRLIGSVANKFLADFFAQFERQVSEPTDLLRPDI
ncbi:carbon monoxide dehydrogenase [Paraburkholderia ginsengiterrae]|uniref:Carbon monoxide dehydrogenase n=1 Tax=Paraburkholderia ginsengiterrae TaxID=1462993 RepID=A0A1A9N855_9BURK|nr:carbon monoxide dehydrogenase subunit G [Paraburkholderia ginsengiterrae]OAJ54963.1 carbon monoxide dehydrogenase [Paraburkholderia ginsengiterrae]OAJ61146.1 carbon monoxide dehydrogenase [Paraburkholderia ginsengiterrae]